MKNHHNKIKIAVLALTVQVALGAEVERSVEIGAIGVNHDSAKFGEYNGLDESTVNGNFNIRGGDAYDKGEGVTLWKVSGKDLGTTSRSLGGLMSKQGKWKLNLGYDELRHNISDTYQTPQQGKMGGNGFGLPSTFGTIGVYSALPSTVGSGHGTKTLTAAQIGAFHTEKVSSSRKNTSINSEYVFNDKLNLNFNYNHLDQSGAKLMAVASQGEESNPNVGSTNKWLSAAPAIIMNPTNFKTDSFDLALRWLGEYGHLTASYYGSIFKDDYKTVSWQNSLTNLTADNATACNAAGNCAYQTNTIGTAPDNTFHQLSLAGVYAFTTNTKLTSNLSYGRNTQDDAYISANMQANGQPRTSLDGLVVTTHADLKLTNQTTEKLLLGAGVKYDKRDNKSTSDTYKFYDIGGRYGGGISGTVNPFTSVNTPYSNQKIQGELAADYHLTAGQKLRLMYGHEDLRRWCNNIATGKQCLASPASKEDSLELTYRLRARDAIGFNAGYRYSKRKADFDNTYISPIGSVIPTPTGGPANSLDVLGFIAAPFASRRQDSIKTGVTWQATERLDLALNGRYTQSKHEAGLGLQQSRANGADLDVTYAHNKYSVSTYVSWQSDQRDLQNAGNGTVITAATQVWTNRLKNDSSAVGVTAQRRGMMDGKMEIEGDLSYSLDKSRYSTQVPYLSTCGAAGTLSCGDTPDIKSKVVTLRLNDSFQLNTASKIALGYTYQRRLSDDFFFNGYQYGATPISVMPTNEQAPSYAISLVTVSYNYTF